MYKIAVLGGSDTVMGFRALGLDTYPVGNLMKPNSLPSSAAECQDVAIIYRGRRSPLPRPLRSKKQNRPDQQLSDPGRGRRDRASTALSEARTRCRHRYPVIGIYGKEGYLNER